MSSNGPVPPRFTPPVSGKLTPEEMVLHLRQLYLTANQHDQAIILVNGKVTSPAVSVTTTVATAGVTSFNSETGEIIFFPGLGVVNNQSGHVTYTVRSIDDGKLVRLNDAAPIAVSLDSTTNTPWFGFISNEGAGTATLTPTSGLINGAASIAIAGGGSATLFFDGTDWEAIGLTGASGVTSFNALVGAVNFFPDLGGVSNQTGLVAYTVVAGDSGQMILLNDAAAIAVTLNSALATPWFALIFNDGAGTATLTPTAGLINGGASLAISGGGSSTVFFDGVNWFGTANGAVVVPASFGPVAHNFINQYNAGGGTFSAAQPAASDLTNGTTGTGAVVLAVSPTLTGVPVAPTAAVNTITTQVATTAFVIGQASGTVPLIDSGAGAVGISRTYARSDHVHPSSSTLQFADNETPAGLINGVNVTYTLAHAPSPAGSLILAATGLIQAQGGGLDYTLAGNTITFLSALSLGPLLAWYRY